MPRSNIIRLPVARAPRRVAPDYSRPAAAIIPPLDYADQGDRRSTLERIADALQSPRFILFYLGFYAGCMATVALAFCWSVLS